MPESLPAFLKRRAERSLAYLLRQALSVSVEEAHWGRRANWPEQPWGIGQDGSIAGIGYHVAAWKQLSLPVFQAGGRMLLRTDFKPADAPDRDDWPAILLWLGSIGAEWNQSLHALPDDEFDAVREWEGAQLTISQIAFELIQHDVQHSAQIDYLIQQFAADCESR